MAVFGEVIHIRIVVDQEPDHFPDAVPIHVGVLGRRVIPIILVHILAVDVPDHGLDHVHALMVGLLTRHVHVLLVVPDQDLIVVGESRFLEVEQEVVRITQFVHDHTAPIQETFHQAPNVSKIRGIVLSVRIGQIM